MACCSEYQTECLKVVTIGYLKSFIGTNIQNSANGSTISISRTDDTYCPTYSELTGGTIIQTWSQGSTPNGDRDGIVVNSTSTGTGNAYTNSQLVNQKDLSLRYTRFSGLTISLGKTSFSECGDSTSVSYSHKYIRYTKSMNNSCSTGTTSAEANDTTCSELTWHPTLGSVSNCNTYSIGKNGSVSASSRSMSVYASVVFRGSTKNSNTVSMSQAALTGSYSQEVSTYTATTSVSASRSSSASFGCGGGTYSATGTRYYDNYSRRKWVDSCGQDYPSLTTDVKTGSGSESLGSKSGTFSFRDCCNGSYSTSASLSFSSGGYSDSVSFTQSCADCSSSCGQSCNCGTDNCDVSGPLHLECFTGTGNEPADTVYASGSTANLRIKKKGASGSGVSIASVGDTTTIDWCKIIRKSQSQITYAPQQANTGDDRTLVVTIMNSDPNYCSEWDVYLMQAGGCGATSCTCSNLSINARTSLSKDGGTMTLGNYNEGTCVSSLSATADQSWVSGLSVSGGKIRGTLTANSGQSSRSSTITIRGTAGGTSCTKRMTITQSGSVPPPDCDCNRASLQVTGVSNVTSDGFVYGKIGEITSKSCEPATIDAVQNGSSVSWITSIDVFNDNIMAVVGSNSSSSSRSKAIDVRIDGVACNTFTFTQLGTGSTSYTYKVTINDNTGKLNGVTFVLHLANGTSLNGGASVSGGMGQASISSSENSTISQIGSFRGAGDGWQGSFDSSSYSVSGYGTKNITIQITKLA